MIKKKVLIVAPYPMSDAQHGGQKRVKAIYDFYNSIFSEVRFAAVYHRGHYPDTGTENILLGQPDIIKSLDDAPYASEVITAEAIDKDIHVRSAVGKLLLDYQPDIIQIEQGYAYLGLKAVLRDLGMRPRIIFSSQNIEHIMKKSIYAELGLSDKDSEELIKKIKDLETELCKEADMVIAVSDQDAKIMHDMGAKTVVIAPNGIDYIQPTTSESRYWQDYKRVKKVNKIVTFVGSGHPPNWIGFLKMIGEDTEFLPTDTRLIIAGGVADYFEDRLKKKNNQKFWKRAYAAGRLSDHRLSALLRESEVLILPITSGGGSNLKTAEAILSGKKIVSTNYAFRGYEEYKKLPNIYLADIKSDFISALLQALKSQYIERSPSEIKLAEHVQWNYCLMPLLPELKRLSIYININNIWDRVIRLGRRKNR
jgi:hypothetical protein